MSTSPDAGSAGASGAAARPLPPRPSLEYERKEAKKLLRRVRSGDPESIRRVRAQWHGTDARDPSTLRLADVQLTIAREYGFVNWPKLVSYFETLHRHEQSYRSVRPLGSLERWVRSFMIEHRDKRPAVGESLAAFVPRFYGKSAADALASPITEDDARLTVARQYGCPSWEALLERARSDQLLIERAWERYVSPRQRAFDAIKSSDVAALAAVIDEHPELLADVTPDSRALPSLPYSALIAEQRSETPKAQELTNWLVARGANLQLALDRLLCGNHRMTTYDVERLLARGADPNWIAPNEISVLEHAIVRYWNPDAVDLLARHAVPRKAFWIAAGLGDVDAVARYVRADGTLTDAARRHRPDFMAIGPDSVPSLPDASDVEITWEAFFVAGLNRRFGVLELLLQRGFPIDYAAWGMTLLSFAIGNRMVPLVEFLVRHGASLDVRGWRPEMTQRELAQWGYQTSPSIPETLRILELCDGGDPNDLLRDHQAKLAPTQAPTQAGMSEGLRQDIARATDEAVRLKQDAVEPHNLFVAMFNARGGSVIGVLKRAGADIDRILDAIGSRLLSSNTTEPTSGATQALPLSPDAQANINQATADVRSQTGTTVTSLHLLVALAEAETGPVADFVAAGGTTGPRVREAVKEFVSGH